MFEGAEPLPRYSTSIVTSSIEPEPATLAVREYWLVVEEVIPPPLENIES